MRPAFVVALATWCGLRLFAAPQAVDIAAIPTMHAEARVVQIDVVVTDSHGKPVTDLSKADFTVSDNGKPRAIHIFSINRGEGGSNGPAETVTSASLKSQQPPPNVFSNRNPGPPEPPGHSTVIVLDQVNAYFADAAYGRQTVIDLMSKLKPDERIALYVIAKKLGLVMIQTYTTDRALLIKNLSKYIPRGLATTPPSFPDMKQVADQPGPPDASRSTRQEDDLKLREDSEQARLSLQALAEHLSFVPGRKSVFWLTHGFQARLMQGMGKFAWDKTVTALNEANVAVNTVDSRGLYSCVPPHCNSFDPWTGTITTMQEIAEETGGTAYFGRNDLDTGMAKTIEASRTTYTLAFYLSDTERDDKFHALKVKADRPGLQLFYRQGYYAGDTELPVQAKEKGELEASLLNQVNAVGVGITAQVKATQGTPRGTINIRLNLDPGTLTLKKNVGGWTGKVEETFIEQNAAGNTLSKVSDIKSFEVASAQRANVSHGGVAWPFDVPLMPEAVKLTILVRDSETGHVGSLTVPLP